MRYGIFLSIFILYFMGCRPAAPPNVEQVFIHKGETMGTYYNIRYVSVEPKVSQKQIDSLLIAYNQELSTWIPSSAISQLNKENSSTAVISRGTNPHFYSNFILAKEMHEESNGFFEPTLNPLINFWGFGYDQKDKKDKDIAQIPILLEQVGFNKWSASISSDSIVITKPANSSLDFSALSKGDGVDVVGDFLYDHGISNYFIDIGGEVSASGKKPGNQDWLVGISQPIEGASFNDAQVFLKLQNRSIATSGNYRRFYEEEGEKYSHIINPFTGMSERSSLLSSSIIHQDCARADAMATASMVMGLNKSMILLDSLADYEGLLIYTDEDENLKTWSTKGFEKFIIEME